jgi:predicted RNA-binding protein Jag
MAKSSVYEGKSYDEAVKKGLDDLGLTRAEATITLVEEGKGGFLGLGARPYRVAIMRRPGGAVREPEERGERRVQSSRRDEKRGGRGGRDRERAPREGQPAREAQPAGEREGRGGRDRDRKREGGRGPQAPQGQPQAQPQVARAEGPRSERREGRRGERSRDDRPREDRPREERAPRPVPAEAVQAGRADEEDELMPLTGGAPVAGGDTEIGPDGQRRRRRRGRRGGRGRRRGGPEGEAPREERQAGLGGVALAEPEIETEAEYAMNEPAAPRTSPVTASVTPPMAPPAAPPAAMSEPEPVETAPAPVYAAPAPRERERDRDRDRNRDRDRDRDHSREGSYSEPAMSTDELGSSAKRLTEGLLKSMGFEATVTVVAEGDRADVTVEVAQGDDLLTGPKGETRQAMQHLLNRFLNRGEGSRYHLQLEINDFWQRREDELAALARSLAEAALSGNAEMVTEYLNSQERRIVHVTLREDTRVKTYALGTGMIKRVAVAPADFPERTGEEDAG